jgi:hypothetical protein
MRCVLGLLFARPGDLLIFVGCRAREPSVGDGVQLIPSVRKKCVVQVCPLALRRL